MYIHTVLLYTGSYLYLPVQCPLYIYRYSSECPIGSTAKHHRDSRVGRPHLPFYHVGVPDSLGLWDSFPTRYPASTIASSLIRAHALPASWHGMGRDSQTVIPSADPVAP
jgi:hypothetical protein